MSVRSIAISVRLRPAYAPIAIHAALGVPRAFHRIRASSERESASGRRFLGFAGRTGLPWRSFAQMFRSGGGSTPARSALSLSSAMA